MKGLKRRAAFSVTVLAMLIVVTGVCMAFRYTQSSAMPVQSEQVSAVQVDPLTRFRAEREQLRQRQRAELNDIIHDDDTDSETLAQAQRQLMEMMEAEHNELQIEGILNTRGYGEVLASVSAGAVNVLVRREGLNHHETAVILDLILRQTGVTSGNVKIIPIK